MVHHRKAIFDLPALDYSTLGVVGGGADVAAGAGPVGVDELAGIVQELVGVSAKIIPLSLQQVCR